MKCFGKILGFKIAIADISKMPSLQGVAAILIPNAPPKSIKNVC